MMQIVKPDYSLRVDVKDGKVIGLGFGGIWEHEPTVKTTEQLKERLQKYFQEAKKIAGELKYGKL